MHKKKSVKSLIQFIIGILILVFLLFWANPSKVWVTLKKTDPILIIALFLIFIFDRLFMAFKWGILLKAEEYNVKLYELVKAYFYSAFVGQFLPASIGGDILRYYKIKPFLKTKSLLLSSIIVEKIFGLLALISVLVLSAVFLKKGQLPNHQIYNFLFFAFIIVLISSIIFFLLLKTKLLSNKFNSSNSSIVKKLNKIISNLENYSNDFNLLILFYALCLFEQIFPITSDFLFAHSLDISVNFIQMAFIISLTLFLARLPIAPSAIGFQEGILVGVFLIFGFTKEQGLAFGLGTRILGMIFTLPPLFFYFPDLLKSIKFSQQESIKD